MLNSYEADIPFQWGYYQVMKTRLKDSLTAYYTDDPAVLRAFLQKYHVNALVVSDIDFLPEKLKQVHEIYFNAFPKPFFEAFVVLVRSTKAVLEFKLAGPRRCKLRIKKFQAFSGVSSVSRLKFSSILGDGVTRALNRILEFFAGGQ